MCPRYLLNAKCPSRIARDVSHVTYDVIEKRLSFMNLYLTNYKLIKDSLSVSLYRYI